MAHFPRVLGTLAVVLASAPLACGGSTSGDGSGGNAGSGGATGGSGGSTGGTAGTTGGTGGSVGGSAGTGGMPPACQVPSPGPGPYAVKFRFTNSSFKPFYVREDCRLQYTVSSCADGYAGSLVRNGDCTVDCKEADTGGCIACGACAQSAKQVTSGAPLDGDWAGYEYTFEQTKQGCDCHNKHVAPAGKYRLKVNVYASEQDAQIGNVSHPVEVDFTLPAPGGIVEVPIQPCTPADQCAGCPSQVAGIDECLETCGCALAAGLIPPTTDCKAACVSS